MSELVTYQTLKSEVEAQFKRQHSRFIGLAYPAAGPEAVAAGVARARERFSDATHHCSAHRLLLDGEVVAYSDDDGEPLNSAGPPILRVIAGRELVNVLVVVVRYFGGTKLGVGGLIRAYSDATKAALDAAQLVERIPQVHLHVRYPHELTGAVMGVLHRSNARIETVDFDERPQAHVIVPLAQRRGLERQLQEASAGRAEVVDVEEFEAREFDD